MSVETYVERARHSMRLGSHLGKFARLATGAEGAPHNLVALEPGLLGNDRRCLDYAAVRARYAGPFNEHFVASLPYVLEEQCRMGAALLAYGTSVADRDEGFASFYFLGDGPGLTGRTLADASAGKVRTLTCSPNAENQTQFERHRPADAHFFRGPFFEVDPKKLAGGAFGSLFAGGFDLIFEDTTFQMYGRERREPILLAMRNLKKGGIFLFLEKFAQDDPAEFMRREQQKDDEFKSRFFDAGQISQKRSDIVRDMDRQLVTLAEMSEILSGIFRYALVLWNSGNFCTVAASDDADALGSLAADLIPAAIPAAYQYLELPCVLTGQWLVPPAFRTPAA